MLGVERNGSVHLGDPVEVLDSHGPAAHSLAAEHSLVVVERSLEAAARILGVVEHSLEEAARILEVEERSPVVVADTRWKGFVLRVVAPPWKGKTEHTQPFQREEQEVGILRGHHPIGRLA